jgi:beta,beta-carotene 9',10'-dioxygenase
MTTQPPTDQPSTAPPSTAPPSTSRGRFAAGFRTLTDEVEVDAMPVAGELPDWLAGTLVRNGPALFDTPRRSFRHWFDGQAMLHRFSFEAGTVSYANRLLDTPASRSVREQGRITFAEFATDPCASLFGRFFTRFRRKPSANASVNVTRMGEKYVALTETPLPVEFDPATLETVGLVEYSDDLGGMTTTAHPHADPATGDLVNFALAFGRHSEYRVYRQPPGLRRELLATVPADLPGYLHSFAITERHVVLVIFPLVVNPLSFVLRGRPFIENFRWRPEVGTRIVVIDSASGAVRADATTAPCFAFHHINAYDSGDDLVIDLCAFPDASVIDALYLERLRANRPVPIARPTRFTVTPGTGDVRIHELSTEPLELPRIAYGGHNGRPYRYTYGCGTDDAAGANFLDQLVKLDVDTGKAVIWRAAACHPGEPVFVPAPDGAAEDEGVVLSVVLDVGAGGSFLLVLDASTFTEVARAAVPHVVPFGFHGQFIR